MQDPLTGEGGKPQHALYFAGKPMLFESEWTQAAFIEAYTEAIERAAKDRSARIIDPFPVLAGNTGGNTAGSSQATPYQEDQIDVLFVRVDFAISGGTGFESRS